jgi:hypothetical protein
MGIEYNNPKIVTDGLVLALDAANPKSYPGSGTTWSDLIGSNDGTLTNGPTFDSGNSGSFVFDGVDDYASATPIEPTYFTLSCTFKATGAPSTNDQFGGFLIGSSIQLTNNTLQYALEYSWANQRVVFATQTNTDILATSNNSVLGNNIHKVDAVYDGSTQKIYVNGQLVTSRSWTTDPIYPTSGDRNVQIGRWRAPAPYNRYFQGNIYNASIYNRALTADEIAQNFNATRGRFGI